MEVQPAKYSKMFNYTSKCLLILRKLHLLSLIQLFLHLLHLSRIDSGLLGDKHWCLDESESRFTLKVKNMITYLVSLRSSQTKGFSNW